jgi:hypothetical protein
MRMPAETTLLQVCWIIIRSGWLGRFDMVDQQNPITILPRTFTICSQPFAVPTLSQQAADMAGL